MGKQLDEVYRQVEQEVGISFARDLAGLGEITIHSFTADPSAGGLIADQVLLVKTDELAPYWKLLEKLVARAGLRLGRLETAGAPVEYVDFTAAAQTFLPRVFDGSFQNEPPPAVMGMLLLGGGLAMARMDLGNGWTALSPLSQALSRLARGGRGKLSDTANAESARYRDWIRKAAPGACAVSFSRGGGGLIWTYNTVLSLAGAFSPFLGLVGIDVARLPPGEEFEANLEPGYVRLEAGDDGFTFRGRRSLESGRMALAAVGGGAVMAGFLVPTFMHARGEAQGVQCANNLKQLFVAAMMHADSSGSGSFPFSPNGSLASLQIHRGCGPARAQPRAALRVSSGLGEGDGRGRARRQAPAHGGVLQLRDGPLEGQEHPAIGILMYDKTPCHGGERNVVYSDGSVRRMGEAEFQGALSAQKREAPAQEEGKIEKTGKTKAAPKVKKTQKVKKVQKVEKAEPGAGPENQ